MHKKNKTIIYFALAGIAFWLIDSILDWVLFRMGTKIGIEFLSFSDTELIMRIIMLLCFVIFGFIISRLNAKKENALKISEEHKERFFQISEQIEEWVWEVDKNGLYTFASPVVEKILGYKPEELVNKKYYYDLFHPDDKEELKRVSIEVINKHEVFSGFLNRNIHKNGNSVLLSTRGRPVFDSDKNLVGYRGADLNLTNLKNAEKALETFASNFSATSGVEFINKLCGHITKSVEVDYAFVGELIPGSEKVTVLGGYGKGKVLTPFEYELENTPCANVMGQSVCCYPKNVQKLFPKDYLLKEMGIESYLGAPIFDTDGKALGIFVVLDSKPIINSKITENIFRIFSDRVSAEIIRLQTEKKLKLSEEKYRDLFENSLDSICILDVNKRFTDVNNAFSQLTGYSKIELLKMTVKNIVHPDDLDKSEKVIDKHFKDNYYVKYEIRIITKHGELKYIEVNSNAILGNDGRIIGSRDFMRDISERKISEQKLKESERKFKELAELLPETIFECDKNGKLTFVNRAAIEKFGYTKDDFDNEMNIIQMIADEDKERVRKNFENVFNGQILRANEYTALKKDGTKFPILTYTSLIKKENKPYGLRGLVVDFTRQFKAAEELKRSEAILKESQRVGGLGSYMFDIIAGYWTSSELLDQIFGIDKDYVRDVEGWANLIHPDDREEMIIYLQKNVLTDHEFFDKQYRIIDKSNNEIKWVHGQGKLKFDDNGAPVQMIGTIRDITKHKEIEDVIKESEERFRSIMHQSPLIMELYDKNGNLLDVNDAFEKFWEIERDKVVNKFNIILSEDIKKTCLTENVLKAYAGDVVQVPEYKTEKTWYTGNQNSIKLKWLNTLIFPLKDKDGEVKNIVIVHEDITDRKIAEEELNKARRFTDNLIKTANVMIVGLDKEGKIKYFNPAAEQITGYSIDKIKNQSWFDLLIADNELDFVKDEFKRLQNEGSPKRFENSILTKNGERKIISWSNSIATYENNESGTISFGLDITELKKIEEELYKHRNHLEKIVKERTLELKKLNEQLERDLEIKTRAEKAIKSALQKEKELNEIKTHFVSMVSHEFRTPLTTILTSTDLLDMYGENWDPARRKEHLKRIQNSVEHMNVMLDEVLTLGRVESGKIKFNPTNLNLKKICLDIINDIKYNPVNNNPLILNYYPEESHFLLDELLIKHILHNLISNAVKFSPEGKEINLTVEKKNSNLILEVSDEGYGIEEKELSRIFDPFIRGARTLNIHGTGLGLTIVKEAVDLHKGKISVKSLVDAGSTFKVIIPVNT